MNNDEQVSAGATLIRNLHDTRPYLKPDAIGFAFERNDCLSHVVRSDRSATVQFSKGRLELLPRANQSAKHAAREMIDHES